MHSSLGRSGGDMGGAEAPLISPPRLAGQQGWRDLRGAQSPVQHGDPPGQKTAPHTCQDCQIFPKNIPAIYGMWLVTLLLLYSLQEGKRKRKFLKYFRPHSTWALEPGCLFISWWKSDNWSNWVVWLVGGSQSLALWCMFGSLAMRELIQNDCLNQNVESFYQLYR